MSTAKLFNLKKTNIKNLCDAMRCTDPPQGTTIGDLWGRPEVDLCAAHLATALAFAEQNPDYVPGSDTSPAATSGTATGTDTSSENTAIVKVVAEGVALPPTWLEQAYASIAEISGSLPEAEEQLELAKGFVINNQDDLQLVVDMTREVKERRDKYEQLEQAITKPLNAVIKRVRFLLNPAKSIWESVEGDLRGKINKQRLLEADRNQKLVDAAAKAQAEGGDATAPMQQITTSTDLEGASTRVFWRPIVTNVDELPDEYTFRVADEKKLKTYAASFNGAEPSPMTGVRFEREAASRITAVKH